MKDGHPGEQEDRRVEQLIPPEAVREGRYEVIIEVSANGMFGLGTYRYQTPDVCPFYFFFHLHFPHSPHFLSSPLHLVAPSPFTPLPGPALLGMPPFPSRKQTSPSLS